MALPPEIAALYQFRMATAEQLRVLHTPDAGPEQMRRREYADSWSAQLPRCVNTTRAATAFSTSGASSNGLMSRLAANAWPNLATSAA